MVWAWTLEEPFGSAVASSRRLLCKHGKRASYTQRPREPPGLCKAAVSSVRGREGTEEGENSDPSL